MRLATGQPADVTKSVNKSGAGGFTFESGAGVQPARFTRGWLRGF
jgi:hypothetical protein